MDQENIDSNSKKTAAEHKRNDQGTIAPIISHDGEVMEDPNMAKHEGTLEQQRTMEGEAHFSRLGWKRLTIILIVEAIALGSLGLPSAFAALGMVAGVLLTVGIGLVAIYASYIIGQVKLKYPEVGHYADIGELMFGKWGYRVFGAVFASFLAAVVGSHCLTGTIALTTITQSSVCKLVFGAASAILLLLLAIPPSFTEIAILGYIDFVSIILAIGITMIATGIQSSQGSSDDNMSSSLPWSAWPREGLTFSEAMISVNSIVFAYAFASAQPSFMMEMHTPSDYVKSIWCLGIIEILIYTLTGAIIYAFVGQDVKSPALLSAGPLVSRIAFGVALPVIFISGSINTTVVCRFLHAGWYKNSVTRYVNTPKGWATWIGCVAAVTIVAWIVAEAIPVFSELLSICASLFISGLSFYIPPIMWWMLLKEGSWASRTNLRTAAMNGITFLVGVIVLVCGTYATILELIHKFQRGDVDQPFGCKVSN